MRFGSKNRRKNLIPPLLQWEKGKKREILLFEERY